MGQKEDCGLDCDRLAALADFCGNFPYSSTVREICRKGLGSLSEQMGYEKTSVVLYDAAPDSEQPFYGLNGSSPIETKEELDAVCRDIPVGNLYPWKEYSVELDDGTKIVRLYVPLPIHGVDEMGFLAVDGEEAWDAGEVQMIRIAANTFSDAILNAKAAFFRDRKSLQMETLINSLPAYIYIKDTQCRFVVANQKLANENNVESPEDLLGKTDFNYYPKEMAQEFFDAEQSLMRSGESLLNVEEQGHNRAGDLYWVMSTKVPLKDEDGHVFGLVGIGLDITEKKKYEQQVQESEECYRTLFENINDAVLVHDENGRILDSNDAAPVLFECSSDELLCKSVEQLNLPSYASRLKTGNPDGCSLRETLQMKQGVELCIDMKVSSINYRGTHAYLVLLRDVTELNAAREKAERAAQAKSDFLANMSHEIRTPLNAVVGMSDLMLDTNLTDEQREFADIIMTSSDSLLTLVNDILDLSKIEAGKLELESVPFDLIQTVEKSVDVLAPKAAEKGLELMQYFSGSVPDVVIGDAARLRQILLNLLSNSIKFTPKGEVLVEVSGRQGLDQDYRINFTVSDTGIGMTPDEAHRIFQPFEQADTSVTRKYGGTGLGLTICNRLVQMMGGEIAVRSEKGAGSEFRFYIVVRRSDTETLPEIDFEPSVLKDKRILVVDDNQTNLKILKHELTNCQMEPLLFESGVTALEKLGSLGPIDLAVLDFSMPEMDGCALAAELRKRPEFGERPILVLSSSGRPRTEIANKINRWLSKPIKARRLHEALAALLGGTKESFSEPRDEPSWHDLAASFPLKILLAEDNKVNQKVTLKTLKKMGYDADLAENGQEAVDAALSNRYDLILMDVQMPVMDGMEATGLILEKLKDRKPPLIVGLSAHALTESREEALHEGMFDYLSKPVKIQELVRVLKDVYISETQET